MPSKKSKVSFTALIQKFGKKGEKTGWTYIEVRRDQAASLKPGYRVSFRVKGKLDDFPIAQKALVPMGEGDFILVLNGPMRKSIGKSAGDSVKIELEADDKPLALSKDLMVCLKDEPGAHNFFKSLPRSHQQYFSNWIESAKTVQTKTKRITMAVLALGRRQGFGEMIRENKGRSS